jgi:hypothetical protein
MQSFPKSDKNHDKSKSLNELLLLIAFPFPYKKQTEAS